MVKANELRIGNWIKFMHPAKPYYTQVIAQHIFDVGISDKIFEPIPLTPEILEKCGLIKDEWDYRFPIDGGNTAYGVSWYGDDLHFSVADEPTKETPIKHLHQLQNLYFALTGEELQVSL